MKFGVLALDYDGTIARDGAPDPDVKAVIMEAPGREIVVILVTGRILSELRRAAGDLEFVDAVVAENGAVLAFPNGQSRLIGHLPPQVFLDELRRRGIEGKTWWWSQVNNHPNLNRTGIQSHYSRNATLNPVNCGYSHRGRIVQH
jgi:hypothetical protein